MAVTAYVNNSGNPLYNAPSDFSPIKNNLKAFLFYLTISLVSLIIDEFMPPQSPLSEVIGTRSVLLILKCSCFFYRYVS
jgi:hypothetical protein